MAAESEYGSQRPSCEYFVGLAVGMGIPTYIPPNSDLCKAASLYGIDTTSPLRIKVQSRIQAIKEQRQNLVQQLGQLDAQREELKRGIHQADGGVDVLKYIQGVWTMPTDIDVGEVVEPKDRGEPMPGSPLASPNGEVKEEIPIG